MRATIPDSLAAAGFRERRNVYVGAYGPGASTKITVRPVLSIDIKQKGL